MKSIVGLIETTVIAFNNIDVEKLNYLLLTLRNYIKSVVRCSGCNSHGIPHMCKNGLERDSDLPLSIVCEDDVVSQAQTILSG